MSEDGEVTRDAIGSSGFQNGERRGSVHILLLACFWVGVPGQISSLFLNCLDHEWAS